MTFYDMIRIWDILVNYIFLNESSNLSKKYGKDNNRLLFGLTFLLWLKDKGEISISNHNLLKVKFPSNQSFCTHIQFNAGEPC